MGTEFAGLDFNSKRLEQRFIQTMETLSRQPGKSIWFCNGNRAEASETQFPQQSTGCRVTKTWAGRKSCGPTGTRESYRWIKTLNESAAGIPEGAQTASVCDREGDMAGKSPANYLTRRGGAGACFWRGQPKTA
jgi:hypothetical protein